MIIVRHYRRRLTERVADDDDDVLLGCLAFFTLVVLGLEARLAREEVALVLVTFSSRLAMVSPEARRSRSSRCAMISSRDGTHIFFS